MRTIKVRFEKSIFWNDELVDNMMKRYLPRERHQERKYTGLLRINYTLSISSDYGYQFSFCSTGTILTPINIIRKGW